MRGLFRTEPRVSVTGDFTARALCEPEPARLDLQAGFAQSVGGVGWVMWV